MPPGAAAGGAGASAFASPITTTGNTSGTLLTGFRQGVAGVNAAAAPSGNNLLTGLMFAMMGINAVGGLISSRSQAEGQQLTADAQARALEANARIRGLQAEDAIRRGEKQVVKAQQSAKRLLGSQRAALGAQGIDIESGSALDIQEETAELGATDVMELRNNAWREAWGFKAEAADLRSRADVARLTGRVRSRSTILTGGVNAAKGLVQAAFLSRQSTPRISDFL
jgi:hypothetical protein